ncbi:hypothetical protein [Sphingopyxis sp. JAI108]|uniref:hypothetical protein n=1 Tax=Sphingopyxis sp. JAI108 TaxID=2723060 RepID=UPI0015CB98BF|nr:hypothetical protein [Sphingopyxis sp. JAI108]NYF32545.1 hypothetical protein [Sphingopyxis sp. JAI108]
MTFALILGGAAALYILWLLFRLAALALPVCAGVAAAFEALGRGYSDPAAIAIGLGLGISLLASARMLVSAKIAPALKVLVALAFAIPAALAGFAATEAFLALAGADAAAQFGVSLAGAAATAVASWRSLMGEMTVVRRPPMMTRERAI